MILTIVNQLILTQVYIDHICFVSVLHLCIKNEHGSTRLLVSINAYAGARTTKNRSRRIEPVGSVPSLLLRLS